jgi:hypothetical protein
MEVVVNVGVVVEGQAVLKREVALVGIDEIVPAKPMRVLRPALDVCETGRREIGMEGADDAPAGAEHRLIGVSPVVQEGDKLQLVGGQGGQDVRVREDLAEQINIRVVGKAIETARRPEAVQLRLDAEVEAVPVDVLQDRFTILDHIV